MQEDLTGDPNQIFLNDGLKTQNGNSTTCCEIIGTAVNVISIPLPSYKEYVSEAHTSVNSIRILNVSGFEEIEDSMFVILDRGNDTNIPGEDGKEKKTYIPDIKSSVESVPSHNKGENLHNIANTVKVVNICGFTNIADGNYVIIFLSNCKDGNKNVQKTYAPPSCDNLLKDLNEEHPSPTHDEPISDKVSKVVKIAYIFDAHGIDDGLYVFVPIESIENSPKKDIADIHQTEIQNQDFSSSLPCSQEQSLVDNINNGIKIVMLSGITGIDEGYYLCIPANERQTCASESITKGNNDISSVENGDNYRKSAISVNVESTAVPLAVEDSNLSENMVNQVKYVNISGMDEVNGQNLIIRLKERRKAEAYSPTNI